MHVSGSSSFVRQCRKICSSPSRQGEMSWRHKSTAGAVAFFLSGLLLLLHVLPSPDTHTHTFQSYNQTDGSYIGSPEMSPLYSIVNALTQTAAAIILILASVLSLGHAFSPFPFIPPAFLPGSMSISPFLSIRSCFHLSDNKCTPTIANTHTHLSLTVSQWSQTQAL